MNDLITTKGLQALTIELSTDAYKLRDDALALARDVDEVSNQIDRDLADRALVPLTSVIKQLEKAREEVKKPVLEVGRRIDSTARDFVAPVKEEYDRISRACGEYDRAARERERIAREAAQRRAEEARRAEMEAIRKAEAEAEAKLREAEEKARKAASEEEAERIRANAEAEAEAAAKRMAEKAKELSSFIKAEVAASVPREVPSGTTVRGTWEYKITNALALYKEHPECFTLTPVKSAIAAALDASGGSLPGISGATKIFKSSVRI